MRDDKIIDVVFFYDYAVSKGFTLGFNEFNIGAQRLMVTDVLELLDSEYELTLLCDKQGNFIKVIT